jgi:hypothetical protein
MKKFICLHFLIVVSFNIFGQNYFIPPPSSKVDSVTYKKYLTLLRASFFQDSIEPSSSDKHNIFIAYDYLNAPIDTIMKFVYQSIAYDPIEECETSCKQPSYTYTAFIKKHPKQWWKVCRDCDSIFARFNRGVMDTLKKVNENDQMYRKDTNLASQGANSEAWKKQTALDNENLAIVENLIKNYGYVGKRLVGTELSDVVFMVIQHAPLEKQELYLPIMQKAVADRELDKINLPYMIDRIRMGNKQPQLYGTQLVWNKKTEKLELYPVEDIQNVDVRRDKMNLDSLRNYLKDNNVDMILIEKKD